MSDLRTAAQQALNALEEATNYTGCEAWSPSMTDECLAAAAALRAALAQQEQEQAMHDLLTTGTGVLLGGERIDPASMYKQEEQEPVAWVDETSIAWLIEHPRGIVTTRLVSQKSPERQMPLYTTPPRREWQSLTDEDIALIDWEKLRTRKDAVRAVDARLRELNHG